MPIGGRTSAMGGAGVAAGNDSAMPYLNPAGLGALPRDVFALSTSVYGVNRVTVDNLHWPGEPGRAFTLGSVSDSSGTLYDLPSSVMYLKNLTEGQTRHLVSISLISPSSGSHQLFSRGSAAVPSLSGDVRQQLTVTSSWRDYYLGPTYAFGTESFNAGLSVYTVFTRQKHTFQDSYLATAFGSTQSTYEARYFSESTARSTVLVGGAQARLFGDAYVGLALALPAIHQTGTRRASATYSSSGLDDTGTLFTQASGQDTVETEFYDQRPTRLSLGFAIDSKQAFSFAIDAHYFITPNNRYRWEGYTHLLRSQSGAVSRDYYESLAGGIDGASALGLNAGAELRLTPSWALRVGAFLDPSVLALAPEERGLPDGNSGERLNRLHEQNRVGASLGLGYFQDPFETSFTMVYTRGTGEFLAADRLTTPGRYLHTRTSASTDTLLFVISGAVTIAEAKATIEKTAPIHVEGVTGE